MNNNNRFSGQAGPYDIEDDNFFYQENSQDNDDDDDQGNFGHFG